MAEYRSTFIWLSFLILAAASILLGAVHGEAAENDTVVAVDAFWSADRIIAGESGVLAVVLTIAEGYHINADERQTASSGDFVPFPTQVRASNAPEDLRIGPAEFPSALPVKTAFSNEETMMFHDRTVVYLPVHADAKAAPGNRSFSLSVSYQACDDQSCLLPSTVSKRVPVEVAAAGETATARYPELFADYPRQKTGVSGQTDVAFDLFGWRFAVDVGSKAGRIALLLAAAIGGMLLNLTPCVAPLVPIKIMALAHAADLEKKRCLLLGVSTFFGVLAFWAALGAMVAGVAEFTAANQLFQYPLFTIGIGLIIAAMAIGMFARFSVRIPQAVYLLQPDQRSLPGAFALGVLMAVLSTPCTAPFMGAAAAWAATQPPATTLAAFAAIGSGMALPYLILSARPELAARMPRSGPASELVKQTMGLLMLAAAAYFVGAGISALTTAPGASPAKAYWWAVAALGAAAGAWLSYRVLRFGKRRWATAVFFSLGALMVAASIFAGFRLTEEGAVRWIPYTPNRLQRALAEQKTVALVFTAEWCLNCKALEQSVLREPDVERMLASPKVAPMKVDITGNNPHGKAKLKELGSLTIPFLAVISSDGSVVFQGDFYTADQIVHALKKARQASPAPGGSLTSNLPAPGQAIPTSGER